MSREELFSLWQKHGTTFESDSSEGRELVDAILAAGYRKPPIIDNDRLVIDSGMLLLEVGGCTCTPYGSSHEAFCGYEYLDDLTGPLERAGYRKLSMDDATVERAARVYEDHWGIGHLDSWECACGEFEASGSDGLAQSAVHRHITRAVLSAAVQEER